MKNMVSMNVRVEVGGGSKAALFVKAIRVIQQDRVKHRTEMRQKWHDVIVTLKVQAASTNYSSNLNLERVSIFKIAPAPAPDGHFIKTEQALYSGDEVPNISVKQTALIWLLLNLFIQSTLPDNPHELEVVLLVVTLILVAILRHLLMKGTNHPGDNLQINTIGLLLIGSMGIPGAHAHEFNNDICLIDSANPVANGNVSEEGDNIKVAAASILAVMVVGGASLWIMLKRRPKFQIDRGLEQTPVATKSNPVFLIHPKVK